MVITDSATSGPLPARTSGPTPSLSPPEQVVSVLTVIVNYRSANLTIDCLRSLEPEVVDHPGTYVVVIENDSGDDQFDLLEQAIGECGWGSWVSLVRADENGGFAAGNNVAIRWALSWPNPPQKVWLLNPDTIIRPGALAALSRFLDQHVEVGLVGSRLEHRDGTTQNSAFRFPSIRGEFEGGLRFGPISRILKRYAFFQPISEVPQAVDWVAGASLMIRGTVFEQIGLLDENYFMYYEEVDFCRRASNAGWACWYLPESRVVHLVGQSSGVTSVAGSIKRRPRYWYDARKRYFVTHHGRYRTMLANLLHVTAFATYRVRRRLQNKPDLDAQFALWDMIRYNFLAGKR